MKININLYEIFAGSAYLIPFLQVVHVAGTKRKRLYSSIIGNLLHAEGYSVVIFTMYASPILT